MRRILCGTPQVLILDGVLQEKVMRRANYTVRDLMDTLRSHDIFDIGEVAYAILETNGTVSVLEQAQEQPVTLKDLNLSGGSDALSHLLVLEGRLEKSGLSALHLDRAEAEALFRDHSIPIKNVFFAQMNGNGEVRLQLDRAHGSRTQTFRSSARQRRQS